MINTIFVEKYQYALLFLLLTNERFFSYYLPLLTRYYKLIFSNKYLRNLFIIIVKKLKSGRSFEALFAYIQQSERDGRLPHEEAQLYYDYLQEIKQAESLVPDFQEHFIQFVLDRLVADYKESLSNGSTENPSKLLSTLKKFQLDVINCLSIFSSDEEDLDSLLKEIEGFHGDLYIPFNFPLEECPGVRKHELCIIGAATGIGKSWFLLHCFWQALLHNKKVLFVSLEMSKSQLFDRLLVLFTGQYPLQRYHVVYTDDLESIKTHQLDPIPDLPSALSSMLDFFKEKKCHFVQSGLASAQKSSFTFDNLLAELSRYEARFGEKPDVIIVDGIEFMLYDYYTTKERWFIEARCVSALKELARNGGFAVMVNSHVIKNIKAKWVYASDLSGGAEKSRVADIVLTLSATPLELSYSIRRLLVAKNRMNVSGNKYWFNILPQKDLVIPNLSTLPSPDMKNLNEVLAQLKTDMDDITSLIEDELVENASPF